MYVLFEGIDTTGKSTQIELLKRSHPEIVTTKEPGGTPFGEKARALLLGGEVRSKRAELLLFLADRAEHYEEIVRPNRDKLVISDRGFISGIGYAMANGDFDFDTLVSLNRFALYDTLPDRVILFLTDESTLRQRLGEKELDGIEARGIAYLLRVQEEMKRAVKRLGIPHLFIDARLGIDEIHQTIAEYLKH